MNNVTRYSTISVLIFVLLSCSAFSSGRVEEPSGKREARVFWILDGSLSTESAEMFLERYLFPTSAAAMLWTEFHVRADDVRFDTLGGYRIVRKQRVLAEPVGTYLVYGYDLIIDVTRPAEGRRAEGPDSRSLKTYDVRFSYPEAADAGSPSQPVLPQPLEQALLAGIRTDGRASGKARVERIEYLGAGRFKATVRIGD